MSKVDFPDEAMQRLYQAAMDRLKEYADDHPEDEQAQKTWKEVTAHTEDGMNVVFRVMGMAVENFLRAKISPQHKRSLN